MTKEVMKQALEALKNTSPLGFNPETDRKFYATIDALEDALKKEQVEPVTTDWERIARVQNAKLIAMSDTVGGFEKLREVLDKYEDTTPQQRTWVGLTDEDIFGIFGTYRGDPDYNHDQLLLDARRIEAKIKERNT